MVVVHPAVGMRELNSFVAQQVLQQQEGVGLKGGPCLLDVCLLAGHCPHFEFPLGTVTAVWF